MIFGAILAGGTGSRMHNENMPKQFLDIGGKPIVIYTVEKFMVAEDIDVVFIGVHKDWVSYLNDLLEKYLRHSLDRIRVVEGGSDRNETIQNIVAAIEKEYGESEDHIIVTHDAVRPFITLRIIKENVEAAVKYGAVDTVFPASDTIVESADGQVITSIPERKRMYQGQTPQSFKMSLLKKLYNYLTEDEKLTLTDACKICVVRNHPVYLVTGSDTNMKITTPGDLKIAKAMVEGDLLV